MFVITSIIHAIPFFYSWGYFRSFPIMTLGMLISLLPSIKLKNKKILLIPLTIFVYLYVLRMLLFNFTFWEEQLLNLIFYPAMVYLTFQFNIKNKIFNYLGSLSFGLYAYQSIPRFLEVTGFESA